MLTYFADAFIIFFGAWTLIHQLSYFGGLNFYQTWNLAFCLATTAIFIFFAQSFKKEGKALINVGPLYVWLAILIGAFLTLFLYRPDADDEHYLGLSILALDFTFEPMKSLPGIGRGYAITSYDFFRAALSYYTGIPILYTFYVVGPVLISIFVVIFQWRLLKILEIKHAAFALTFFFIVMLAWGDIHRSPANLGYVKFFQGKGALVWISIPAMLFYWLKFEITRNKQSLALLVLSAICGVGFSATGIPIAVLLATLFFASGLIQTQNKKKIFFRCIFFLISLLVLLGFGLIITRYFGYFSSGIHTSVGVRDLNNFSDYLVNWEMLHFVLGDTKRFWVALLSLAICPFILPKSLARNFFRTYLCLCVFLMTIPFSSAIMAQFSAASFAWRWLFVCPFILCIMIVADYIVSLKINVSFNIGLISIYIGIFIFSGPLLISEKNHTQFRFSFHQLADENNIVLRPPPYNNGITKVNGARIISLKDGKLL